MTSVEARLPGGDDRSHRDEQGHRDDESDSVDYAQDYAKAILNILDDFGQERVKQEDNQRAVINILEDMDTEKARLESTQKALVNILDDFDVERIKVEEANAGLHVVNEAMRGFIAVAAHDLRSPLASIVGFSGLLTESWDTLSEENRRKFVATIDRQSHNLSMLVDDLFTLSSIEGGALHTSPERVDIADAINTCLEASHHHNETVSVSCASDLVALVDPHHLSRMLDNYVQNAFKYGDPPVRIEVSRVDGLVEIRVIDHGPGVPLDFVPRLFGKFARADAPRTRAQKGTGLGLSIVRGLAEVNGGGADYEPKLPHGSCFIVRLRSGDGRPPQRRPRTGQLPGQAVEHR